MLLVNTIVLSFTITTQAAKANPNGLNQQPEPGWSVWRPKAEIPTADFYGGFSNSEFGAFLDFEQACSEALGTPKDETPYWFLKATMIGAVSNGATVEPDSFPATIIQADSRNWVAIQASREGWVSNRSLRDTRQPDVV